MILAMNSSMQIDGKIGPNDNSKTEWRQKKLMEHQSQKSK